MDMVGEGVERSSYNFYCYCIIYSGIRYVFALMRHNVRSSLSMRHIQIDFRLSPMRHKAIRSVLLFQLFLHFSLTPSSHKGQKIGSPNLLPSNQMMRPKNFAWVASKEEGQEGDVLAGKTSPRNYVVSSNNK